MLDVTVPGGFQAAAAARRAVDGLTALDPRLLEDVRFMLNELVTNSVRHGRIGNHQSIRIRITEIRTGVRVEVRDPGPGFTHVPRKADADPATGWGLYLVDALADRWGVDSAGSNTCVWLELDRGSV